MKKFLKWLVILAFLAGGCFLVYKWYSARGVAGEALQLIPNDAIYAIVTEDPIESWKQIASTKAWAHMTGNAWFAELTSSANSLDSLIRDNDLLFDLIGSRSLIMSAHMTGVKDYDFLFLVDLQGASGIKFLNDYLTEFDLSGYKVKKEKYNELDVIVLHNQADNSNLHISMPGTFLLLSFNKKILTDAIDAQTNGKTLSKDKLAPVGDGTGSIGKMYVNYEMLPAFMGSYSDQKNEYVSKLSEDLLTTSLDLRVEEDLLTAKGYTYVNDSVDSYIRTLESSGKARTEFFQITPQRAAFCLGLGFESFSVFFSKFQENIRKDVTEYDEYMSNMSTVENYLKISIQKQVIDWIGEEVALLQLQSSGKGLDDEVAVILKANNIEKARKDLDYIEKMVRKRTPVKFKAIDHRGFAINYLGMKGMFKILLGKFFSRYDKPYYTIINNFVVFSNHPQTLESMIDDYLDQKTLDRSDEFRQFRKRFDEESSVFVYVNTPVLFNTIRKMTDAETKASMQRNKSYITCFRHVGFQLVPESGRFVTLMAEQFEVVDQPQVAKREVLQGSLSSDTTSAPIAGELEPIEDPVEDDNGKDPMELPYIYVKNLNAKSFVDYYEDSTVHFKVELKNGFKDGSFTEYYEDGKEKMTGKFKRDKRDGRWKLFDRYGDTKLFRVYEDGEIKREREKE